MYLRLRLSKKLSRIPATVPGPNQKPTAMKKILFFALIVLSSCSIQKRAAKVHTLEMNNLLDRYYETVWNPENNTKNEKDSLKKLVIQLVKESK